MKRLLLAALVSWLAIGASLAQTPTAPEQYKWTVREVAGGRAVAWSIRKLANGQEVVQIADRWTTEQPAVGNTKAYYGTQSTWMYECANAQYMHIADRFYDTNGKQTQNFPGRPNWIPFSEARLNEPLFRSLCGGPALPPNTKTTASSEAAQVWLAGLLKAAPSPAAFKLGAVVKIREASTAAPANVYEGTWTRRGTTNIYDASWTYLPTGQKFTDVLEVGALANGQLTIKRASVGNYTLPVGADGKPGKGKASWASDPAFYWEIVSSQ